jgi:hypothetical protein
MAGLRIGMVVPTAVRVETIRDSDSNLLERARGAGDMRG